MGPPSSTVAAPNIRVPDTIAERTSRMRKAEKAKKKIGQNRPEIRAELAAVGFPRDSAIFLVSATLRRTRRVWVVIGVRLTARHLTCRYCPQPAGTRHVPSP